MRNRFPQVSFSFENSIFVLFFILVASFGSVYADTTFIATLDQAQETPPTGSTATGGGSVILNSAETQIAVTLNFSGLSSSQTAAHIHKGAIGVAGPVEIGLPNGIFTQTFAVTPTQVTDLKAGLWYFNVHSTNFAGGEIRGQIQPLCTPSPLGSSGCGSTYPGSLDISFGTSGKVTTQIGSAADDLYASAIQSDGKIIGAGRSFNSSTYDFALVRYNTDGSLDTTFGTGGKVTTPIGSSVDVAFSVAIQSDGKIVVAGYSFSSNNDFAVVRYNSDGTLDTTFGTGGKVTTPVGSFEDVAWSVAIQSNGKIVAAGRSSNGSNWDFAVVRYNTNGTLDTTFGTGGLVTTPIGSFEDYAYSVAIQNDGKIVASGFSFVGSTYRFTLVRYNTDGSLDNSFGTGGIVTTPIGSFDDRSFSVAIQSDGKIVAVGYSHNGLNEDFAIVRYNTDGSLDNSFGTGGKVTTPIGSSSDYAQSVGIQSNGKIVVAGYSLGSTYDFAVVRYNIDGSLDTTFGTSGKVTTSISSSSDFAFAVVIQSDGKIVVAGYSLGLTEDCAVVRYNSDGTVAPLSNLSVSFSNIIQPGNTVATTLAQTQIPLFNNGYSIYGGGLYYDIRTSALYSGNITVTLNVPNVLTLTSCNSLRLLHFENFNWTGNTNGTPSYNSGTQTCTLTQTVTSLSPFAVGQLAPTAAGVSIAGLVLTNGGRGLRNASVSLIDSAGNTQTVRTSSFGNYSFEEIPAGQTVTITVNSKMYHYQPQVISVNESLADVDFLPIGMKSVENRK